MADTPNATAQPGAVTQDSRRRIWQEAERLRELNAWTARPLFLLEFIAELSRALSPRAILDPWVTSPLLIAVAADAAAGNAALGLTPQRSTQEVLAVRSAVEWRSGDCTTLLRTMDEDFDLVLVDAPLGQRANADPSFADARPTRQLADLIAFHTAPRIRTGGHLVFHTHDDIFWAKARRWLTESLAAAGLHTEAVVSVDRALAPHSMAPTSLVILGTTEVDSLFVGRLEEGTRIRELVSNLIARVPSEDPRLGTLVAASSFRGWHKLANEQEVAQLFGGYELHALQDVAEISRIVLRPGEPFDPPTNCVFLPTLGFGDAMTRPPNLDGKRRFELLQLEFDPSVARAEYVAALLSSEPGVRLRKAGATGTTIPHLSKDGLTDIRIPLPPFAAQERAVRSARLLASMEATVARLRHDLWRRPEDAHNVLRELEHAVRTDPVDRWIEALPYPLASILQHYAAQRDPSTQVERLLHFFEATAQFSCAVLMSILINGPSYDDVDWATIGQATRRQRVPFARADFGLWTTLGRTLSHEIQRLSGVEHLRNAVERGAGPATELVWQLADEQLWHILGGAKSIRNDRAHGGISSTELVNGRLGALETLLTALEETVGPAFEEVDLVQVDQGRFTADAYVYPRAQRLRGPRDVFNEFELKSLTPIESERLAFVSRSLDISPVLTVLPLVRLGPATSSSHNACYFLTTQAGDGSAQYKSYHFEHQPLLSLPDSGLAELVRVLQQRPS